MGDDIDSSLSSMAVCFDFRSAASIVIGTHISTGFNVITQLRSGGIYEYFNVTSKRLWPFSV